MKLSENQRPSGTPLLSPQAMIGLGVTIAELGILCLLLGWAEHMRSVPAVARIWLVLGAVLFVLGGFTAFAGSKSRRR